ncbi:hypothetical protein [Pseudonocardia sp. TRM90224]|uniref:hypothetical protein n=1 Tax=Pseudonocardia sp. TRM90224 TaxID=2812678 RepID=UPI001E55CE8F|nr:hypothetical protein [Pseudonocardia sp. TRM90224]
MIDLSEPAAATVCPPGQVQLTATAFPLGTQNGWRATVDGIAVDDRYVYATHAFAGLVNSHDSPGPGHLVVFERSALAGDIAPGEVPPHRRIQVGWQPRSVASLVRPEYERVFVANYHQQSYSVTTLDRSTWKPVATTSVGMAPIDLAVHTGRGRAYLSHGPGIRVIDARTGLELPDERIETGRTTGCIAVDEATDTLFVTRGLHDVTPMIDELVVIDLVSRAVVARIALPAGSGPLDVAVDPVAGRVHVAAFGKVDDECGVLVLDRSAMSAPATVVPTSGVVRAVTIGGGHVYAAVNNRLEVLDVTRLEPVGGVALNHVTGGVAVDPQTGEVYAGDLHTGQLFRVAPVMLGTPIGQHPHVAGGLVGAPLGAPRPTPDGDGSMQPFEHATVVATADHGAVRVSRPHATTWLGPDAAGRAPADSRVAHPELGNPVGETVFTGGAQVSYFTDGIVADAVIAGQATYTVVTGRIWDAYRAGGDVTGSYGWPTSHRTSGPAGASRIQHFEHASIYQSMSTATGGAVVVQHGRIYDAWYAEHGGPAGPLGLPTAPVHLELHPDTGTVITGWLLLERGALVWNNTADVVVALDGTFWQSWQLNRGHTGELGLPVSGVRTSPHDPASPVRFIDFERGCLVWFPEEHPLARPDGTAHAMRTLELYLSGFHATQTDENIPGNPPDIYVDHWLFARYGTAEPFLRWDGRLAGPGGDWSDQNHVTLDPPVQLALTDRVQGDLLVAFALHGHDADSPDGDDLLGALDTHYTVDNLWGMKDLDTHHAEGDGTFDAYYVLKPQDVPTDLNGPFRSRFFWQFDNFDTERMNPQTYGRTFSDVEPGFQFHVNPLKYLDEGWEHFFYHQIYKGVGKNGNCFGMSLEAINAFHDRSPLPQPIYDLPRDEIVTQRINIVHGYQLGADSVAWVATHIAAGLFGLGGINNGNEVFDASKAAFDRGDRPVLNMVRSWKQSGHSILPIRWVEATASSPREIWIADPSLPPTGPADIEDGFRKMIIEGDGRWHYGDYSSQDPRWLFQVPYSVLRRQPRLPSPASLGGDSLFLLGGDAATHQVTDSAGRTLYRTGLPGAPGSPTDLNTGDGAIPGLHRLPLFGADEGPVDVELHLARGRHDRLTHEVVGRTGSAYGWVARTGSTATIATVPGDGVADRFDTLAVGTGRRAVAFGRAKNTAAKTISLMLEAMPADHLPRTTSMRQYLLDELTVTGGQQVQTRLDDGGRDLLVSVAGGSALTCRLRMRGTPGTEPSRPRHLTVPAGRTVRLRPSDWSTGGLDGAPVQVQLRETPDGPPVQCYDLLPDDPPIG